MRQSLGGCLFSRAFLQGFYALQNLFPGFCGKDGAYPASIPHKD
jgi:hypothetical protein